MTEIVTYDVDTDGICQLSIDAPGKSMNTMSEEVTIALCACIDRALADATVKGVVLASGKPSFIAGADLKDFESKGFDFAGLSLGQIAEQLGSFAMFLRKMETSGKPFACAINGTALGAGLELALACHYRVCTDDPKILLGLPESNVGLLPGAGGTQRLLRLLGIQAAGPLLLQGKMLAPADALAAKLIDKIVPLADLISEAKRWLRESPCAVQPWDVKGYKIPGGGNSLEASFRNFFSGSNSMIRANSYGNYPAMEAISIVLYEGAQVPMEAGLRIEAKYFTKLLLDPVSKNLIRTMFVNKGKADKLEGRPDITPKVIYSKIGVVGAGTMGGGIAFSAAKAKIDVVLIDVSEEAAARGKAYAAKKLDRDISKGRTTRAKADEILARIHPSTDYAQLAGTQIVIETVFEDRKVKAEVIGKISAHLPADAILASNTSAMPITGLAAYSLLPDKFIGMHFFSPADRMPLVEIIRGKATADATLAKALDFVQAIRKTPITVNDSPGFFTSRFIGSFIGESLRMVDEGVKPAIVENAALMLGMPMGALTISDSIGLEIGYHAGLQNARDAGIENPDMGLVGKLVTQHNRLGLKNGKGFYDYAEDGSKRLWPGFSALVPTLAKQPDVKEIKARILYAQLCEGARAFAEGVLVDVIGGDLGATLGVGFPAYLGGPFAAIDTIGAANVVKEADRLAALYGDAFNIPPLLRDMAANGSTFYGTHAVIAPGALKAA